MGGILTGGYQFVTGAAGLFGGSPARAAADEAYASKVRAAELGEVETKQIAGADAAKVRSAGTQLIAKQRTMYAASGVDPSQGTPLDVMSDTRLMSELDARTVENNAARRVRGYREQKRQAGEEYRTRLKQDEQDSIGSMLSGIGNLTTGSMGFSK